MEDMMKKIMILFSLFCMMIVSLYPDEGDDFRKSLGLMPIDVRWECNTWIPNKKSKMKYIKEITWKFIPEPSINRIFDMEGIYKELKIDKEGKVIEESDSYYLKRKLFDIVQEAFDTPEWQEHIDILYNYEKNRLDISYFGGDREIGEFLNKYFDKSKNNFSSPWRYERLESLVCEANNSKDPPHPEVTIDMCGIDVDLNDVTPEAVKDVLAFIYKKWDIKLPK